jgi:hypothetical protein
VSASLAEYLDSTPEFRARRDYMLGLIDEYEENRRHPHKYAAGADGIVRMTGRFHSLTGELLPLDPPVEVHHDDVDWLLRLWEEGDLLDWELMRAGAS